MVRKHYRESRQRAAFRRRRPKAPAPKHGWLISELAELSEVPFSTVRYYVQLRLLRPIERRGTATRYDRNQFLLLLGLLRLKSDEKSTLAEKKKRLDAMGNEKLESWLRSAPLPVKAAQALGLAPDVSVGSAGPGTAAQAAESGFGRTNASVEHLQRITLIPGLDLMLRADAKEAARILAQRIVAEYVG
jgi:DNA-binding transcriptional MerR regulator